MDGQSALIREISKSSRIDLGENRSPVQDGSGRVGARLSLCYLLTLAGGVLVLQAGSRRPKDERKVRRRRGLLRTLGDFSTTIRGAQIAELPGVAQWRDWFAAGGRGDTRVDDSRQRVQHSLCRQSAAVWLSASAAARSP